jgi:hypothetical protein
MKFKTLHKKKISFRSQTQMLKSTRGTSTAGALRGNLAFGGHISLCTVIRRLHDQGMRARRPIKRPQLTLRHRHARFDWSHDLPSRTYKSNLQSKEKQPQTVTPPASKAVVPKMWLS